MAQLITQNIANSQSLCIMLAIATPIDADIHTRLQHLMNRVNFVIGN